MPSAQVPRPCFLSLHPVPPVPLVSSPFLSLSFPFPLISLSFAPFPPSPLRSATFPTHSLDDNGRPSLPDCLAAGLFRFTRVAACIWPGLSHPWVQYIGKICLLHWGLKAGMQVKHASHILFTCALPILMCFSRLSSCVLVRVCFYCVLPLFCCLISFTCVHFCFYWLFTVPVRSLLFYFLTIAFNFLVSVFTFSLHVDSLRFYLF